MSDGPGGIGGGVAPAPKVAEAESAAAEPAAPAVAGTTPPESAEASLETMGRIQQNFENMAAALQARAEHATQLEQAIIADRQNMAGLYQQVQQLGTLVKHVNSRFGALEMAIKAAPNNRREPKDIVAAARVFLSFVDEMPTPPAQPLPGETPPGIEDEFGANSGSAGPDKVTH